MGRYVCKVIWRPNLGTPLLHLCINFNNGLKRDSLNFDPSVGLDLLRSGKKNCPVDPDKFDFVSRLGTALDFEMVHSLPSRVETW